MRPEGKTRDLSTLHCTVTVLLTFHLHPQNRHVVRIFLKKERGRKKKVGVTLVARAGWRPHPLRAGLTALCGPFAKTCMPLGGDEREYQLSLWHVMQMSEAGRRE